MAAQLMKLGLPRFAQEICHFASDAERAQAAKGHLAYAGTYHLGVDEEMRLVVNHTVDVSLFQNWLGTNQTRVSQIDGKRLILELNPLPKVVGIGVNVVLRWKRAGRRISPGRHGMR
ncbi:hypothetical protein ETB97_009300 [Aspergillus alliaceus]|uniref:Lipocalin-like domain-containing protein n=1 Tax=Petromyces alliaceus TaxID=209559 RepID=A0A8H6E8W6_PETAA|nr:hypothetical protein ETB97_009300 [Aspergillus burnettii]